MSTTHITGLRGILKDIFQDALAHYDTIAEARGEPAYLVIRNEYESGLAIIDTLVTRNGQFVDREALLIVRQSLVDYLDAVPEGYVLKRRRLQHVIEEIDAVEKVLCAEGGVVA